MKRRTFLTAVATAGVAGWALFRRRSTPVDMFTDRVLIDPLELGPRRTTPPPCRDVLEVLPELANQARDTIRLHPRQLPRGRHILRDGSKLGGEFLWPAGEPWPTCDVHHIPWIGILQLRAEDVPRFPFKPGADLFQLLWCPQEHDEPDLPTLATFWRSRSDISEALAEIPQPRFPTQADLDEGTERSHQLSQLSWLRAFERRPDAMRQRLENSDQLKGIQLALPAEILNAPIETEEQWQRVCAQAKQLATELEASITPPQHASPFYVPNECMLFPELVREYPDYEELSEEQRERLRLWDFGEVVSRPDPAMDGSGLYYHELSVADGTKLGGHVRWIQSPESLMCDEGHPMEHLLTIASWECSGFNWPRWVPVEEQNFFADRAGVDRASLTAIDGAAAHAMHAGAGLMIGDNGNAYVFVCRQCDDWPIRYTTQWG